MSNLFKYKIALDADLAAEEREERNESRSLSATTPYLALILVFTVVTTVFSAIVMILNYCFPGSLDGTYLKLFF